MSGPTYTGTRTFDQIRISVHGRGRAKFARESAAKMLKPGEELEPTYESHPVYGYKVNVVATPLLLTPEERELVSAALGQAAKAARSNTMGYYPSNIEEKRKAAAPFEALKKRVDSHE